MIRNLAEAGAGSQATGSDAAVGEAAGVSARSI